MVRQQTRADISNYFQYLAPERSHGYGIFACGGFEDGDDGAKQEWFKIF
jgi:hypothetical protein